MHCAGCTARVERLLQKRPGVESCQANFSTGWVEVEGSQLPLPELLSALEKAGFPPLRERAVVQLQPEPTDPEVVVQWLGSPPGLLGAEYLAGLQQLQLEWVTGLFRPEEGLEPLRSRGFQLSWERTQGRPASPWPRAWAGLALAAPMSLAMLAGEHLPAWLQALLTTLVLWIHWPMLATGLRSLTTMDSLVSLGAGAAYLLSAVLWWQGQHELYFESAAMVVAVVQFGRALESTARGQAVEALQHLQHLRPRRVRLSLQEEIDLDQVVVGQRLLVLPGDRIGCDGRVLEGESSVDESLLTGESEPQLKGPGSALVAGTVNGLGSLWMEVEKLGCETRLEQLAHLMSQAQLSKTPVQRVADRVTAVFVPVMLGLGACTWLGHWMVAGDPLMALIPAATVLVVACPCALGLATPLALVVASGRALKLGILPRQASLLEGLDKLERWGFDKTGTLTLGRPRVLAGEHSDFALQLAAGMQGWSNHPLGQALLQACRERDLEPLVPEQGEGLPGLGVRAVVEGQTYELVRSEAAGSRTASCLRGPQGELLAQFEFVDEPRSEAAEVLEQLRQLGKEVVLLSGDRPEVVAALARQLGIERHFSRQSPEQKLQWIEQHPCVYVGDGLNDGPALQAAAVGVAVSGATDLARHSAGIQLLRADLRLLPQLLRLSRQTRRVIAQNLAWACLYNALLIPLAASGSLSPSWAGLAMALSSLSVVLNSLRLRGA